MKLTKYQHACVVLEEQGKKLVIDPGGFTTKFGPLDNIVAVVVTHVHGDHLSTEHLQAVIAANPEVKVFTTPEVVTQWPDQHAASVQAGDEQTVGPFVLRFYGQLHNEIHPIAVRNQNVGVLVNGSFYYPGDSFTLPDRKISTLALPGSAPWLKLGEAIDFMKAVNPTNFFRTHDGLLSDNGILVTNTWLTMASEKFGPKFHDLRSGDSIEI